jgi:hypothetical protein
LLSCDRNREVAQLVEQEVKRTVQIFYSFFNAFDAELVLHFTVDEAVETYDGSSPSKGTMRCDEMVPKKG